MVRPVLSCPYCGAFRSAVSLDGEVPPPPRIDQVPPAAEAAPAVRAPRPDEDGVIHVGPSAPVEADEWEPVDAEPDGSEPPLAAEPFHEIEDEPPVEDEPSAREPRAPRATRHVQADRSVLDAVPAPPGEPAPPRRAARVESSVAGVRSRPGPDMRRTGRLDRGAPPDAIVEAETHTDQDGTDTPELPREPLAPRAPARRRRASPELSRRPAGEAAAAGSAWLASSAARDAEADAPSIDEVVHDAGPEPRRRGRGRSLVHVPDEEAAGPAEHETRRRGRGGWIALLLVLLVVGGGIGYAAYWIDKAGVADLLRSPNREISSLGEAAQVAVPAEWTSVAEPGAGGAVAVLVSADGPYRMRVDGTVYTLDGDTAVRVPVKASTLLELKALGSPVTASVTRMGETVAAQ